MNICSTKPFIYINSIINIVKYVKNWKNLLLLYYGKKGSSDIKLRSGFVFKNVTKNDFDYPSVFCKYGKIIEKGGKIFMENNTLFVKLDEYIFKTHNIMSGAPEIYEVFLNKDYEKFDFKNKSVVDIGAFIGDTATFFASKGAKKVYAFEPNPELYELLSYNINVNNLENVVEKNNIAIGDKNGIMDFFVINAYGGGSILNKNSTDIKKKLSVNVKSIYDVFTEIGTIDILKIDCEGCEYALLQSLITNNLGDKIKEGIILEVHFLDSNRNSSSAIEYVKQLGFRKVQQKYNSEKTSVIYGKK